MLPAPRSTGLRRAAGGDGRASAPPARLVARAGHGARLPAGGGAPAPDPDCVLAGGALGAARPDRAEPLLRPAEPGRVPGHGGPAGDGLPAGRSPGPVQEI